MTGPSEAAAPTVPGIRHRTAARRRALLAGALAGLAAALGGCAATGDLEEAPRVSLVNVKPVDIQLLEQRYRVTIRVQNPNAAELRIRGLSYELHLNDELFGTGVSGERTVVPAFGEATVDVDVISTLARLLDQFQWLRGQKGGPSSVSYAIKGTITLDGALLKIPFERAGVLELPGPERESGQSI